MAVPQLLRENRSPRATSSSYPRSLQIATVSPRASPLPLVTLQGPAPRSPASHSICGATGQESVVNKLLPPPFCGRWEMLRSLPPLPLLRPCPTASPFPRSLLPAPRQRPRAAPTDPNVRPLRERLQRSFHLFLADTAVTSPVTSLPRADVCAQGPRPGRTRGGHSSLDSTFSTVLRW